MNQYDRLYMFVGNPEIEDHLRRVDQLNPEWLVMRPKLRPGPSFLHALSDPNPERGVGVIDIYHLSVDPDGTCRYVWVRTK